MFTNVPDAIFWIAVVICAVAQAAILRSALRTHTSAAADTNIGSSLPQPRPAIEIAWVVIPALALALVLAFTWRAMRAPAPAPVHAEHLMRSGD